MQKTILCGLTVALAATCLAAVSVAQEVSYTSLSSFNALQDRLTEVETRLASLGGEDCGCDYEVGCDGGCSHCTTSGFTVHTELMFLRAYEGAGGDAEQRQYILTPRITAGFVRDDGLGVRVRAFVYESEQPGNDDDYDVSYGDAEITDKFQLGCWDGVLSGGVRGAHYKEVTGAPILDFTGYGPLIGASLTRQVRGNLHLVGSARYAVLFGRDSIDDERVAASVAEIQLGTEYRRQMCGTSEMFLRSAWETQYWSQIADDDEEDFGLIGYSLAVGITR